MDAFQRAVDDARRQLELAEGRQISMSELLRRAGFRESTDAKGGLTIKGARYHLEPGNNRARKGGHRIPAELVEKLSDVLPVGRDVLQRAAQVAAGFTEVIETGREDIPTLLVRYLGDAEVTEQEKAETTARLLQVLAEQTARIGRQLPDE